MNDQPIVQAKESQKNGGQPLFMEKKRPKGWGVTRLPRETEKKIYFMSTLAMLAAWLISRLWSD